MGAAHIFLLMHGDALFSLLFTIDGSVTHLFFMHTSLYYCLASDVLDHRRNLKPPYVLHMGVRSAVNKKKQTMLYPWLLPKNVVDTIFDVRGLCDDGFQRQLSKAGKRGRESLAAFFRVAPECWPCVFFVSKPDALLDHLGPLHICLSI
jgi:hypothetical protein